MKTRMVEERIGERLSDIDWSYDFAAHGWGPGRGGHNPDCIQEEVTMLKKIEAAFKAGEKVFVKLHGCIFEPVCDVGMYDGWPFWRPTPSVMSSTWLGPSWHPFTSISGIQIGETP